MLFVISLMLDGIGLDWIGLDRHSTPMGIGFDFDWIGLDWQWTPTIGLGWRRQPMVELD